MNKLLKVLIADDEEWIIKGMQKMIPWEVHGFTISAVAYDGISAVELACAHNVDIAFLDIRMPGLNGLEALKEIRKQNPNAVVAIVSGYAEFAYAQKAVKNGASDYLLKPIDNTDLLRCLSHMKSLCLKQSEQNDHEMFSAESAQLQDICEAQGYTNESRKSVLHFRKLPEMYSIPSSVIVIATHPEHEWLICASPVQEKELVQTFADKCHAGLSEGFYNFSSLAQARRQATVAASSFWGNEMTVCKENSECDFEAVQAVNQLWKMYSQDNLDYFFTVFDKLETMLSLRKIGFQKSIALYNNLVTMQKSLVLSEDSSFKYLSEEDILTHINNDKNFFELLAELRNNLHTYLVTPSKKELPISDNIITEIINYINLHFCDREITVEKLATVFYISPAYFGQLFKKSMGVSIMEYINKKRCDFAEYLLINDKLTVREVSVRVGIEDYYYFNKLYKKHKLTTPGKVRRENGGHDNE